MSKYSYKLIEVMCLATSTAWSSLDLILISHMNAAFQFYFGTKTRYRNEILSTNMAHRIVFFYTLVGIDSFISSYLQDKLPLFSDRLTLEVSTSTMTAYENLGKFHGTDVKNFGHSTEYKARHDAKKINFDYNKFSWDSSQPVNFTLVEQDDFFPDEILQIFEIDGKSLNFGDDKIVIKTVSTGSIDSTNKLKTNGLYIFTFEITKH